jgi:hypothetical protein
LSGPPRTIWQNGENINESFFSDIFCPIFCDPSNAANFYVRPQKWFPLRRKNLQSSKNLKSIKNSKSFKILQSFKITETFHRLKVFASEKF